MGPDMGTASVKVLVADQQDLYRAGLCAMLKQGLTPAIVRQATSFAGLVSALETDLSLDLVAVSARMLGIDGLRRFRVSYPDTRWVMTGTTPNREVVLEALAAGIHGYVPLDLPTPDIQAAFRSILSGAVYVPPAICDVSRNTRALTVDVPQKHAVHLTSRQQEVMALIARGKTSKEMSRLLGIAEGTVKVHMAAAYRSLGVHNRVSAVAALRQFQFGVIASEPLLPGIVTHRRRGGTG